MVFVTFMLTVFLICNRLLFFSAKMIMPMAKAKMNKVDTTKILIFRDLRKPLAIFMHLYVSDLFTCES